MGTKIIFKGGLKLRIRAQNEEQGLFSELCDVPVSQVLDAGDSGESAVALVSLFFGRMSDRSARQPNAFPWSWSCMPAPLWSTTAREMC